MSIDLANLPDDDVISGAERVLLNDGGTAKDVSINQIASFALGQNVSLYETSRRAAYSTADVALAIFLGQSNAEAQGLTLAVGDQITTPLTNVFVLPRTPESHLDYSLTDVTWRGFASNNWGISPTQGTNHVPTTDYYVAKEWQRRKTEGEALPDLYMIHVSRGNTGIDPSIGVTARWSPDRSDQALDAYYHLARHLITLAIRNLQAAGKNVRILNVNGNLWEADIGGTDASRANFPGNLAKVIAGISDACGCDVPWNFWRPRSLDPTWREKAAADINAIIATNPDRYSLIDAGGHPDFVEGNLLSIFQADQIHYQQKIYEYSANILIDRWITQGLRGVPVERRFPQTPTSREMRNMIAKARLEPTPISRDVAIAAGAGFYDKMFPPVPSPTFGVSPFRLLSNVATPVARVIKESNGTSSLAVEASLVYNSMDIAAIAAHLAGEANQAYVEPVDQISNTPLTQTTIRRGPRWKPEANAGRGCFLAQAQNLTSPALNLGTTQTMLFVVDLASVDNAPNLIGSSNSNYFGFANGTIAWYINGVYALTAPANRGRNCYIVRRVGSAIDLFLNGEKLSVTTASVAATDFNLTGAWWGGGGSGALQYVGEVHETTLWQAVALTDAQIASIVTRCRMLYTTP